MNILKFVLKYKIVITIIGIGVCISTTFLIVKTKNKEASTPFLQENLINNINSEIEEKEVNVVEVNQMVNVEEIQDNSQEKSNRPVETVKIENTKTNTFATEDTTPNLNNNILPSENTSENDKKNDKEDKQENEQENSKEDTDNYQQATIELQEAKKIYDSEVVEINNWYNEQSTPIKKKIEEYNSTLSKLGGPATEEQVEGAIRELNFAKENAAFDGLSYSGVGAEIVKKAEEHLMNVRRRCAITEDLKTLNMQLSNLDAQKQEKLNIALSTYKQRESEIRLKYGL